MLMDEFESVNELEVRPLAAPWAPLPTRGLRASHLLRRWSSTSVRPPSLSCKQALMVGALTTASTFSTRVFRRYFWHALDPLAEPAVAMLVCIFCERL